MKFQIERHKLVANPYVIARKAGYGFIRDRHSGQESLVRRLGNHFYPRFHLYIEEEGEKVTFSLHLDQKKASYAGSHRHNAEYGGELVEREITHLKKVVYSQTREKQITSKKVEDKKSFWRKLWG